MAQPQPLTFAGTYMVKQSVLVDYVFPAAVSDADWLLLNELMASAALINCVEWFQAYSERMPEVIYDFDIVFTADPSGIVYTGMTTRQHTPTPGLLYALGAVATSAEAYIAGMASRGRLWPAWAMRVGARDDERRNIYVLCCVDERGRLRPPCDDACVWFTSQFPQGSDAYPDHQMQSDMIAFNRGDGRKTWYIIKKFQCRPPSLAAHASFVHIRQPHWQELAALYRGPKHDEVITDGVVAMISHELWRLNRHRSFFEYPALTIAALLLHGVYVTYKNLYSMAPGARSPGYVLRRVRHRSNNTGASDDGQEDRDGMDGTETSVVQEPAVKPAVKPAVHYSPPNREGCVPVPDFRTILY